MQTPLRHATAITVVSLTSVVTPALAADPATDAVVATDVDPSQPAQVANPAQSTSAAAPPVQQLDSIQVTGRKLDAARNNLSPETGSTISRLEQKDILALPFGEATPLNQLILHSPGAV
jgi:hypothetical protein